jgi:3-oxoacyl-[acyl-carrier-protein] synthase-3
MPIGFGGLGGAIPRGRITNDDLAAGVDTNDAWIVERTGIRERRWAAPGQATSDLAVAAGRVALADAGLTGADIDLLVVCTCSPDQPLPSTSSIVAGALGIRCGAMDLAAACSGWVYGLVTASSMLSAAGGRHALLIGAEVISPWLDPADRTTMPLFGDGAGATVLSAGGPGGLVAWDLGVDGTGADLLRVPAGGSRQPVSVGAIERGDQFLKMDGREIFRRAVRVVERSCLDTLSRGGVSASEVALFVPHQANSRIVDAILPRIGVPAERTMMNIERYGNTSSASIPLALCEAATAGRIAEGDLVLVCGFGAGMTWASALVRWGYTGAGQSAVVIS